MSALLWGGGWLGLGPAGWLAAWGGASAAVALLWAFAARRARAAQAEKSQQEAKDLHVQIQRTELSQGSEAARAVVQEAYAAELRDLSADQARRARALRENPAELANFLQNLADRPPN